MTVYIDLFFMVNFITDMILVTLTCGRKRTNIIRRIVSSVTGSLYACLYFTELARYFFALPAKLAVLAAMCAICLVPCRIKEVIEKFFRALFISVFLSGAVFTLGIAFGNTTGKQISDLLVAAGIWAGYLLLKLTSAAIKKHRPDNEYKITIYHNNKKITLTGICDSGNSLRDSKSGLPVIIADFSAVKKLFPGITSPRELCEFVEPKDFRVIPYKTIDSSGIAYGFVPQRLLDGSGIEIKAIIAAAPIKINTDMLYNPMLLNTF